MLKIPSLPIRIVVAGCGHMSNAWIKFALSRPDRQIVGLVDPQATAIERVQSTYNLPDLVTGPQLAPVIKESQASLVFNLAVPAAHFELSMTAFSLGCAVVSEKPLAESMQQADEMVAFAAEKKLFFAVMQNRRYLQQIRSCRQLIESGTIGQCGLVGADFFLGPRFGGFRDLMDSPLLLDMAIHTFDQARFLTGAKALSVYCQEFNLPGSWYRGNASALAIFTMENGIIFDYRGSWSAIGCPTSWEASWQIRGSQGCISWDGHSLPFAEVQQGQEQIERMPGQASWSGREGHTGCLDAVFTALLAGQPAETAAADNRHSLAMVMAAIESARLGRPVAVN